ncbi:autotransporter family protein [Bartonella sp. B23]
MIKIFRNHVYLCTFTTAVLSFLQNGVGVCANAEGENGYSLSGRILDNGFYGIDSIGFEGTGYNRVPSEDINLAGTSASANALYWAAPIDSYVDSLNSHVIPDVYGYVISDVGGHVMPGVDGYAIPALGGHVMPDVDGYAIPEIGSANNGFYGVGSTILGGAGHDHVLGGYDSDLGESGNFTDINITPIDALDPNTPINAHLGGHLDGHEIPEVPHTSIDASPDISMDEVEYNATRGRKNSSPYFRYVGRNNNRLDLLIYDGPYYICDNCGEDKIGYKSYQITRDKVSKYPPEYAANFSFAIRVKGPHAVVHGKNITVSSGVSGKIFENGVFVSENGKAVLTKSTIKNTDVALYVNNGIIEVDKTTIDESATGVQAIGNPQDDGVTRVVLTNTKIKTRDGKASFLGYRSAIKMEGGEVDFTNSHGVYSVRGGRLVFDDVAITGRGEDKNKKNHAVFFMDVGGSVNFQGVVNATDVHGMLLRDTENIFDLIPANDISSENIAMTEINIKSSSVTVNGKTSYGIYFQGKSKRESIDNAENSEEAKKPPRLEAVNLRTTMFSVPESTVIYSTDATYGVVNLMQSNLSGSSLLKVVEGASVKVLASASTLEGGTYVDDNSTAELYLGSGSTWILKQKEQKNLSESDPIYPASIISLVSLMDSSIKFQKLESTSPYNYQTLHIGKGSGKVYIAQNNGAKIYLNTYLNAGGSRDNQKTDRVLVYGDVSGTTLVHVHAVSESPGGSTGSGGNNQGISIIQVSGEAEENSFKLNGGYVALENSPYQYRLYAYGPKSDLGKADSAQRLVRGEGDFWDFRLENRHVDSEIKPEPSPAPGPKPEFDPHPRPDPGVRAVVPQVPTYLLLPNALFQTGLINIGNQGKWVEALRIAPSGMLDMRERSTFFVRGYGGNYRYTSNLSALEYGYGGELDSNTLEAGVLLQTVENEYGNTSFGIIGSYERLTLQPLDVEQSQKSEFDKWTATVYGSMQHNTGFYVDALLSYGLFQGDVLTLARGKTAKLKGNPLSASLASGKAFMIGDEGLIFDPQVQVVYQNLRFNKTHDVDGFDIDMGKLDQWIMRVGGRLVKIPNRAEKVNAVAFYGKLYFSHGFGGARSVHFKDAFQLGAFGSSLETGLGFNARLSQKFVLHGDLSYQHKLTKAGFSGTSFSGGIRYKF